MTADRIIVPLDVPSYDQALDLIDRLPQVTFWKVGLELFVSSGPAILQDLKARQKKIFLDLKFHDIPNTMAGACQAAAAYGVDLLTIHATAGGPALQAAQQAAQAGANAAACPSPTLLAVTLLTSISPETLNQDLQVTQPLVDYVQHLAHLAQSHQIGGVVCSPQEIVPLRQACGPDLVLVCPGIRPDWASKGDQQRTLTPSQALQAGASYLVIGRPITQAADPIAAFTRICDEINPL